ncbi:septation ring formation regulator EzrA [Neobacillus sp. LXY-1]|uniref:septation ring formation regulator EzrA n=1 Tax=Neobacillus sp. LXY-1 TaxID=3379133 RepID=UPI003EE24E43
MQYVIGVFILLLALFVFGFFIKKKYFREMDRLESWKIDLNSRPIPDEMSKVKQLNMTGQTEELFEHWRNQWDDVVAVKLPSLEDMLFDAEEYIDKYRFKKAKEVQNQISEQLQGIENQINTILEELHELVGSEEKNRLEIDELKEIYRESKKTLLAHRHSFGNAEKGLEKALDEVTQKFQDYEEKTEQGNYLEAREVVLSIHSKLGDIKYNMSVIPQFLIECQSLLPNQISEVLAGFREMNEQNYYLEHVNVEKETKNLEEKVAENIALIEKLDIKEAEEGITEVKQRIDVLFDLLEKEVHAKHFIIKNGNLTGNLLSDAEEENKHLAAEVHDIQSTYHLSDHDLEELRSLQTELATIEKRYDILNEKIKLNNTAQSLISEELIGIKEQLDVIRDGQHSFALKLQTLRKDELEAREKVRELAQKMKETVRLVTKSNVPGLPGDYSYLVEDTNDSIQNVWLQLEEKPLNISALNQYLEIAELTVEKLVNATIELIENVTLAEKAIQYGNRYRTQYPSVAKGLLEAEQAFRRYDYQEALEQAAATLEGIDPEALKKIKTSILD